MTNNIVSAAAGAGVEVTQADIALAEEVCAAANIVSHDGYYEADIERVAATLGRHRDAAVETLRHKLWMIACHATGGGIPKIEGIDRSINDICVQISAHNNAIWKHAQEAALRDAARGETA